MDRLRHDAEQCYWIRERGAEKDIVDTWEDSAQIATEVKIAFPMSHNTLTRAEEYM
jgi:hypothetical protein